MDIGLYQGASALDGLQQYQDILASNIAASHVAGFKKTEVSFEAIEAGELPSGKQGGINDSIPGSFATLKAQLSFHQGELRQTDNPHDVALQGPGFFVVQDPNGGGEPVYTRDGNFHVSPEGVLVTAQGYEVQGNGGSIQVDETQGDLVFDINGNVFQGEQKVDKILVVDFEDPNKALSKVGGGFVISDGDARTRPVEQFKLLQGFTENSNVMPIKEMVNMMNVARAYEANRKVVQEIDGLMGRAVASLGQTR